MKSSMESIHKIIDEVVREEYPGAHVQEVRVYEADDADGEPILRVQVIFQTASDIDSRKTPGLVRRVWPRLNAVRESRFPLFSLMTSAEARKMSAAAA